MKVRRNASILCETAYRLWSCSCHNWMFLCLVWNCDCWVGRQRLCCSSSSSYLFSKTKELQSTMITIRQPKNRMINKAGCLWLQLKYGTNYTMNKTKKITLNVHRKVQKVQRLQYQLTKSTVNM